MSSRTLRIFTGLSVLLLLGMGAVQWAWLRQAYRLEDRDFDQRGCARPCGRPGSG